MKFSITIPAYKGQYLDEAIHSVCQQTYGNWELIIVDDFSPDNLEAIISPYLKDCRISYYRNMTNCGALRVVDNWNICLSHCTGDFVICMGDDDRLTPTSLEHYAHLIKEYPNLNVYHGRTQIINSEGTIVDQQEIRPSYESMLSLIWNRWDNRNKQYIGDFCYNRIFLQSIGGYVWQPLAWGADDMTAVLAAQEKGIANTESYCFQYRDNHLTISRNTSYAMIKIKATLYQYTWYTQLLEQIAKQPMEPADLQLLKTIHHPKYTYYYKSLGKECTDYIKGNPLRLLECYQLLKPVHFSPLAFCKWYASSIYHIFKTS